MLLGDAVSSDLTDAQGRLLQRNHSDGSIEQFSYRVDGRLLHYQKRVPGFENPVVASDYAYDALDRRVAKQVSEGSIAVSQAYSYLGASDKILEGKAGDGTITLYMDAEGIDEHLGEIAPQGAKVFIRDHLGSVLNSDASGGAGVFGAFGEDLGSSPNLTAAEDPVSYGFTGRQRDPESGLYYYRARMYDPATGRFVSEDPIGFGGGDTNLFKYGMNNTLNFKDPVGLYPDEFGQYINQMIYINSTIAAQGTVAVEAMAAAYTEVPAACLAATATIPALADLTPEALALYLSNPELANELGIAVAGAAIQIATSTPLPFEPTGSWTVTAINALPTIIDAIGK